MIRLLRLAAILSVLAPCGYAVTARAGALRECMQGCRVVQDGCVEDVQEAYLTARADCEESGGGRECAKGAKQTRKTADRACRKSKKSCKPCCKLGGINACRRNEGVVLPAEPQESGDPVRGRALLLEGDYMTCGVPAKLWDAGFASFIAGGFGSGTTAPRIAGHFDGEALGWPFVEVPYGQDEAPEAERELIYDTTKLSQSNLGHPFGDHLTDEQRRAVIEYQKTL